MSNTVTLSIAKLKILCQPVMLRLGKILDDRVIKKGNDANWSEEHGSERN
jgi:hypothetical protein